MITEPNVQKLLKVLNVESRYTLVVAAAKRARDIAAEDPDIDKTVSLAVDEIYKGKIVVRHPDEIDEEDVYSGYSTKDN